MLRRKHPILTLVLTSMIFGLSLSFMDGIYLSIADAQERNSQTSSCKTRETALLSSVESWIHRWNTDQSDHGGELRHEGRQLVIEIAPFIKECADVIYADSIANLFNASHIVLEQIYRNVRFEVAGMPPGPLLVK